MSDFNTVKYEHDEAVAIITINRPDAMNSFDEELRSDLLGAFECAAADDSVRAVVLTGEGRSFSAGADLKAGLGKTKTIQEVLQSVRRVQRERRGMGQVSILGLVRAPKHRHDRYRCTTWIV